MQNFSRRLEMAIASSGIPKGVLAAHCGVALSTVSRWLDGTIPKSDTLKAIAIKLSVDPIWLLTGLENPPPVATDWTTSQEQSSVVREDTPLYGRQQILRETPNHKPDLECRVDRLEMAMDRMAAAVERIALALEQVNLKRPPQ